MVNIKHKDEAPSTSKNILPTPKPLRRDPSLPTSLPTFYKPDKIQGVVEKKDLSCRQKFFKCLYDREKRTFCGRTCRNWLSIIIYSTLYLISLAVYSLLFLYGTLMVMKQFVNYGIIDKVELLTYSKNGIGLSGTPTSVGEYPLIWYERGSEKDYKKYIDSIEKLLVKRRKKREVGSLGPCGEAPYGYGESPCVLLKINKQLHWKARPLTSFSSERNLAPKKVQNWIKKDNKFWHFCEGYSSFDKEHLRRIQYYPDPPGVDPSIFPLNLNSTVPLVAIQISNFTTDISLVLECKLWYEGGPSSFSFVIYITSGRRVVSRKIDSKLNKG